MTNAAYLEELYQAFVADPSSVPERWQAYFQQQAETPVQATVFSAQHTPKTTINPFTDSQNTLAIESSQCAPEMQAFLADFSPAKPIREALNEAFFTTWQASTLEGFLHTKFRGAKRFSSEGLESSLALLNALAAHAKQVGTQHIFMGMAHRARVATRALLLENATEEGLANTFARFREEAPLTGTSGDVKYHLGASGTMGGVPTELLSNPSHLGAVMPVVLGKARAFQDRAAVNTEDAASPALPILLHGDSAFAGQGVTAESLQMSGLEAYQCGGAVHVVLDNQLGFTAEPSEAYRTPHCTDIAKGFGLPVLHVSASDVQGVLQAAETAMAVRTKFGVDVVIRLVGWRKYGHNEGDDPTFTNPLLYKQVAEAKPIWETFQQQLESAHDFDVVNMPAQQKAFEQRLSNAFETKTSVPVISQTYIAPILGKTPEAPITQARLESIANALTDWPEGFIAHPKMAKLMAERSDTIRANGNTRYDWGTAELAAYGSLVQEGVGIRLIGQDAARGTFSHRHGVLIDQTTGQRHTPLNTLAEKGNNAAFHNSFLSEYAAMGFELGYSLGNQSTLTIWEAQFGDFANGAQIILDQFLSSQANKWGDASNLTLLLPHGYEGMGPEHSSARLERFLQLSAENNWRVCQPTRPAQLFHLLRSQVQANRPLVILTPKSLLRNPNAASDVADILTGTFQPLLAPKHTPEAPCRKLVLCSGKLYEDMVAMDDIPHDVAIARLEQLYPLPAQDIMALFTQLNPESVVWAQEEPQNQGAWHAFLPQLWELTDAANLPPPTYIGRAAMAATSEGYKKNHTAEQMALIQEIFA